MYRWKDIRREAGVGRAVKRKTEAGKMSYLHGNSQTPEKERKRWVFIFI